MTTDTENVTLAVGRLGHFTAYPTKMSLDYQYDGEMSDLKDIDALLPISDRVLGEEYSDAIDNEAPKNLKYNTDIDNSDRHELNHPNLLPGAQENSAYKVITKAMPSSTMSPQKVELLFD